jgi:hypothetical protein
LAAGAFGAPHPVPPIVRGQHLAACQEPSS